MQLECVFFGTLREAVGEKTVRFETTAESVGDLLADSESAYPALEADSSSTRATDRRHGWS